MAAAPYILNSLPDEVLPLVLCATEDASLCRISKRFNSCLDDKQRGELLVVSAVSRGMNPSVFLHAATEHRKYHMLLGLARLYPHVFSGSIVHKVLCLFEPRRSAIIAKTFSPEMLNIAASEPCYVFRCRSQCMQATPQDEHDMMRHLHNYAQWGANDFSAAAETLIKCKIHSLAPILRVFDLYPIMDVTGLLSTALSWYTDDRLVDKIVDMHLSGEQPAMLDATAVLVKIGTGVDPRYVHKLLQLGADVEQAIVVAASRSEATLLHQVLATMRHTPSPDVLHQALRRAVHNGSSQCTQHLLDHTSVNITEDVVQLAAQYAPYIRDVIHVLLHHFKMTKDLAVSMALCLTDHVMQLVD